MHKMAANIVIPIKYHEMKNLEKLILQKETVNLKAFTSKIWIKGKINNRTRKLKKKKITWPN